MNDQQKRQLQQAALMVAEHQHMNDPEIKLIRERVTKFREDIQQEEAIVQNLKRDMSVEMMNMRKLLLPLIPADLRD